MRYNKATQPPLSAVLLLISSALFALLALGIALGNPLQPIDQALSQLLQLIRNEPLDRLMITITLLGDSLHLILLSLPLAILLWRHAQSQRNSSVQGINQPNHNVGRRLLIHWFGALLLVMLLVQLFKFGLAIERPPLLRQPLGSYSFPSGHSANSSLFFPLLAFLLAQQHHHRWVLYAFAAMPVLLIGFSRIYLGVHWFSDVVAGWLLGLAVCAAVQVSLSNSQTLADGQPPLFFGKAGLWTAGGAVMISAIYLLSRIDSAVIRYLPLTAL